MKKTEHSAEAATNEMKKTERSDGAPTNEMKKTEHSDGTPTNEMKKTERSDGAPTNEMKKTEHSAGAATNEMKKTERSENRPRTMEKHSTSPPSPLPQRMDCMQSICSRKIRVKKKQQKSLTYLENYTYIYNQNKPHTII
ncbi:MAG: hypothetical protein LBF62_13590 [Tannerellaceae bacterium]|jgi:hypothetical protein|nr:hypothetical protein [Tannerellaceae bacterium]